MLLIQIVLAVAAWKKGWRWMALVPFAITYSAAFLIGAGVGLAGGIVERAGPLLFLLEIGLVVALVVLALRRPRGSGAQVPASNEMISVVPRYSDD